VWPMAVLMLVMGVFSPYWIRAIDGAVTGLVSPDFLSRPVTSRAPYGFLNGKPYALSSLATRTGNPESPATTMAEKR
jgi:hypothetical protein